MFYQTRMKKIITQEQIQAADAYTIMHEPIASVDLMERAAKACFEWFMEHLKQNGETCVSIVCGMGNNGGDGLALARMLHQAGIRVQIYIVQLSEKGSPDFETNLARLQVFPDIVIQRLRQGSPLWIGEDSSVVVDALFGSGLNRPIEGWVGEIIEALNKTNAAAKVAIDISSGLFADRHTSSQTIFQATDTLCFQLPKLAFFFPENNVFVGSFHLLDIGLHHEYIDTVPTQLFYVEHPDLPSCLTHRKKFSHKGNFGHALLISGSYGKMGAAILSAKACMYSGAGLVTVHLPKKGVDCMQTAFPEAMVSIDVNEEVFSSQPEHIEMYAAAGVGPGLGTDGQSILALESFIRTWEAPLLLDADALNIAALYKDVFLPLLKPNTIITPHVKEFERWVGKSENDFDRLRKQQELAQKHRIIVVLKGAYTCICLPDGRTFFNATGNPGMATAGSGDVLTGCITGLLAQGVPPEQAAIVGVYLHGKAGDIAAEMLSQSGMVASDIALALRYSVQQ